MKEVISGDSLENIMKYAVNMISDATKTTLGPTGNNVIINNSEESVFITNDGVTIAENICSNDQKINSILEIVKESSLKTNELVGDGTTTTLVLLQSIFNNGLDEINNGKNRIELKNELNDSLDNALTLLDKLKKKPSKKDFISIASTSCNDKELGFFLANIYFKMKNKYSIKVSESHNEKTYYEIKKGYNIELSNISNIYFKKDKEIILDNCFLLIIKGYLTSLEQISDIINDCLSNDRKLVILVEDMDQMIKEEVLTYYLNNKNIYIFTIPEYASRKEKIELDLSKLSNSNIKNIDYEKVLFSDCGIVERIIITKDELTLLSNNNEKELIKELEKEKKNTFDLYDKEFIEERISKLKNGIATIYVGGKTKTEIKEKSMRVIDALSALDIAKKGVVLGEGVTFLNVSNNIVIKTVADKIIKEALTSPFKTIFENIGLDYNKILDEIKRLNYNKVYNYESNMFESIDNTKILDPIEVVKVTLKNAISIATILLSTNYLVINENINNDKYII